jgi:hypothetical protein
LRTIKITERTPRTTIPYTMILSKIEAPRDHYRNGDVKIEMSDLEGEFRLTKSQQKRIVKFLKEVK